MASFTLRTLYSGKESRIPIEQEAGGALGPVSRVHTEQDVRGSLGPVWRVPIGQEAGGALRHISRVPIEQEAGGALGPVSRVPIKQEAGGALGPVSMFWRLSFFCRESNPAWIVFDNRIVRRIFDLIVRGLKFEKTEKTS